MDLRLLALVAAGGAIGAAARYALQQSIPSDTLPLGTMTANLLGSLILGILLGAVAAGVEVSEETILLFGTGILGAFTTMSTFAVDTIRLADTSTSNTFTMFIITIFGSITLAWFGWRAAAYILS
mgnify:FL=1|jgi:CrcB protein|tara:strand:- start:1196 stop:1570 length:375 start_codon:yes stop_codon:yes gene_type:complete